MNTRMFENPVTTENIAKLGSQGWSVVAPEEGHLACGVVAPEEGHLACGDVGKGRYPENELIIEEMAYLLSEKPLAGMKALVTAGPTRERIDNVRYITNRSSGKMGYAIARASFEIYGG